PSQIAVHGVSCRGQCDRPIACMIENTRDHQEFVYKDATEADLRGWIQTAYGRERLPPQRPDDRPKGWKIDVYNGRGEYNAVRKFLSEGSNVGWLLKQLEVANLRGMGGAGFPTFKKWSAVKDAPGSPKYIVCNADESEPGTFKDRELLRLTPYLVIEGM